MYSFESKQYKQPVMHLQFTKKFEDKWALIFLIVIPIIELMRILISKYGKIRLLQIIETRWYNVILPPMENNSKSMFSSSTILNKIFSLKSLRLCSRKKPKQLSPRNMENVSLLPANNFEIDVIEDDTDIEIELGLNNPLTPSMPMLKNVKSPSKHKVLSSTSLMNKSPFTPSPKNKQRINMESLNSYDAFKVISTITMFIDHYGYFGLPGLTTTQSSWSRVIGRTAAPGFFFLAGYSSKKFRTKTWFAALFLYICTSVIPLRIVHSPWESIMNILLMNCIFYYIPPHRIKNPLIHGIIFMVLQYYRSYASGILNIGYGTIPMMLAIAGDLTKNKHYMAKVWVLFAMSSFAYSSNNVFASNNSHSTAIICESVMNALMMMFFTIIEIPIFNKYVITRFVRDGLKWLSRTGLVVYCGHLCIFRLVQLAYYSGQLNHIIY